MKIQNVIIIVRGTDGQAARAIFDAKGEAVSGSAHQVLEALESNKWAPEPPKDKPADTPNVTSAPASSTPPVTTSSPPPAKPSPNSSTPAPTSAPPKPSKDK